MAGFLYDARYALRMLLRHPGFTASAVITLALGIGANTAIYSVIDAVLLSPLPYADPDRLVYVNTTSSSFGPGFWQMSSPNFDDFRSQNDVLESMAVSRNVVYNLTGGDEAEFLEGARVSAGLLRTLRVKPVLGRDFLDAEEKPGAPAVVLLSYGLWNRRFGGGAGVLGQSIGLDGDPYTVVGVLPPDMRYPEATSEFLIPFVPSRAEAVRGNYFLRPIGRLKPGVTLAEADSRMKEIARRLEKEYPDDNDTAGVELVPLRKPAIAAQERRDRSSAGSSARWSCWRSPRPSSSSPARG